MIKNVSAGRRAALGCLLAGLAAGQALAQDSLQVYGLAGVYAGSIKRSGEQAAVRQQGGGGLTTSFIGLQGKEALGDALQAVFALESFFRPDTGEQGRSASDPLFSRNAWVGIEGHFGRVTLGRQTNPTYLAMSQLSPFGSSTVFSPMVLQSFIAPYGGTILGDTVCNNALRYASPAVNGFKGTAIYGPGEIAGQPGQANLGLHGSYTSGKFMTALSAQRLRINAALPLAVEQKAYLAGAAYDFGSAKGYASLVRTSIGGGPASRTAGAGAALPVSEAGAWLAEVAQTRTDAPGVAATRRTTAALGYDHRLSARTDVYAIYMFDRKSGAGAAGSSALGIRHVF